MILADSMIVVEFTRSHDPAMRSIIAAEPAAICGITRAEVLHGARDFHHRRNLLRILSGFHHLPFPESLWDHLGDNLQALQSSGVTVSF